MLGYFTQMPSVTVPLALLPLINMRIQRSENTVIELGPFNMEFSLHWSLLQLVAWDGVRPLFYRHLADTLATHWGQEYNQTINWLRCHLSFTLLRCAIMCIRGSRLSVHHPLQSQGTGRTIAGGPCRLRASSLSILYIIAIE